VTGAMRPTADECCAQQKDALPRIFLNRPYSALSCTSELSGQT
jgi:hypothetical protein